MVASASSISGAASCGAALSPSNPGARTHSLGGLHALGSSFNRTTNTAFGLHSFFTHTWFCSKLFSAVSQQMNWKGTPGKEQVHHTAVMLLKNPSPDILK